MAYEVSAGEDWNVVWRETFSRRLSLTGIGSSSSKNRSVAFTGEHMLVSAVEHTPKNRSGIVVYEREPGTWTYKQTIASDVLSEPDRFIGAHIVAAGNYAVTSSDRSVVILYRDPQHGWRIDKEFSNVPKFSNLSVAISGSCHEYVSPECTILVGEEGSANNIKRERVGEVRFYSKHEGAWKLVQQFTNPAPSRFGRFGDSVALRGNLAFASATSACVDCKPAVHLYQNREGTWYSLPTPLLAPATTESNARFGAAIAFDGETLVVGAPAITAYPPRPGAAYVYTVTDPSSPASWQYQRLERSSNARSQLHAVGNQFGASVAVSGNRLWIGAPSEAPTIHHPRIIFWPTDAGAVYEYVRNDAQTWADEKIVDHGSQYAKFGHSIAVAGDEMVVGSAIRVHFYQRRSPVRTNQNPYLERVFAGWVNQGQVWERSFFAADNPLQNLTFSLENAPSGMSLTQLSPRRAQLHWAPAPDGPIPPGEYTFRVRVTDDQDPPLGAIRTYSITYQSTCNNGRVEEWEVCDGSCCTSDCQSIQEPKDGEHCD